MFLAMRSPHVSSLGDSQTDGSRGSLRPPGCLFVPPSGLGRLVTGMSLSFHRCLFVSQVPHGEIHKRGQSGEARSRLFRTAGDGEA